MKQIRNSVFETNSSSTHVLCLNKNMLKEKHILGMNFTKEEKYPDDIWDNYLLKLSDEFANMSFDTDWIDYSKHIQSPYQKLRYIYTYCMNKGIHICTICLGTIFWLIDWIFRLPMIALCHPFFTGIVIPPRNLL